MSTAPMRPMARPHSELIQFRELLRCELLAQSVRRGLQRLALLGPFDGAISHPVGHAQHAARRGRGLFACLGVRLRATSFGRGYEVHRRRGEGAPRVELIALYADRNLGRCEPLRELHGEALAVLATLPVPRSTFVTRAVSVRPVHFSALFAGLIRAFWGGRLGLRDLECSRLER